MALDGKKRGSGYVLEGVRIFLRMSCLISVVSLAVF